MERETGPLYEIVHVAIFEPPLGQDIFNLELLFGVMTRYS
jgi:hypothetical protein